MPHPLRRYLLFEDMLYQYFSIVFDLVYVLTSRLLCYEVQQKRFLYNKHWFLCRCCLFMWDGFGFGGAGVKREVGTCCFNGAVVLVVLQCCSHHHTWLYWASIINLDDIDCFCSYGTACSMIWCFYSNVTTSTSASAFLFALCLMLCSRTIYVGDIAYESSIYW